MKEDARRFGNPFETAHDGSFYKWLKEPMNQAWPDVTRWSLAMQARSTAPSIIDHMNLLYQKEEAIRSKDALISAKDAAIRAMEAEIHAKDIEIHAREMEKKLILNSLSWKVTAPLRKAVGILKG